MSLKTIDLIVRDVPTATAFFRDVVGLEVQEAVDRFAQLAAGDITIMLSPDAMVPVARAGGIILHFESDDVVASANRARTLGVEILKEPFQTDWGWESCLCAGPENIIIDFYKTHPS